MISEKIFLNNKNNTLLKFALSYAKPYKNYIFIIILLSLIFAGLTAFSTWLIKYIMDELLVSKKFANLYTIIFLVFATVLGKQICSFSMEYMKINVMQKITLKVSRDLYQHVLSLSHKFFSKHQTGDLMSRIARDVSSIPNILSCISISLIKEPLTVIGLLGYLFYLSWRMTLVGLFFYLIIALITLRINKRLRQNAHELNQQSAKIWEYVYQSLYGISIIKAFTLEPQKKEEFSNISESVAQTNLKGAMLLEVVKIINELFATLAFCILLAYGAYFVSNDHITIGTFVSFVATLLIFNKPVTTLININAVIQRSLTGVQRVVEIFETTPQITNEASGVKISSFNNLIKIKNISFEYENKNPILKNVSFDIRKGECVALIGPSGEGKTTFVNLMVRFYDPTDGSIEIDGYDLKKLSLESLRTQIGLVTQETIIFNDTIKNNILVGNLQATREEIVQAAIDANAHNFIMSLKDKYETVVGDRGFCLSGGEKQRIAIARALLKNPAIIIFDEATSSLDTETEKSVQNAIDKIAPHKTIIIVSHRMSSIKKAQRIFRVENGQIKEVPINDTAQEKEIIS